MPMNNYTIYFNGQHIGALKYFYVFVARHRKFSKEKLSNDKMTKIIKLSRPPALRAAGSERKSLRAEDGTESAAIVDTPVMEVGTGATAGYPHTALKVLL